MKCPKASVRKPFSEVDLEEFEWKYSLTRVWNIFTPNELVRLRNQFKIFIIQACI